MNENESNKNREYWENPTKKTGGIDGRIKETFIKYSKAQKTKAYDMYSRFYRWAMDRIGDDGLICFITNNSFINSITFDGFRASVQKEFQYAYIIDLGGNIRELSGKDGISLNERHTIFGTAAAVGIAIGIFLKDSRRSKEDCTIKYIHPCDIRATREEKLEYLSSHRFEKINFENVQPDQNNNWINITDNDWDSLIPLVSKDTKQTKRKIEEAAVFKLFSLGVITARDEWVYDWNEEDLIKKIRYLIRVYNQNVKKLTGSKRSEVSDEVNYKIKWSRAVKNDLVKGRQYSFKKNEIVSCLFRPFVKYHLYFAKELNEMQYQLNSIFYDEERKSPLIAVLSMASANELSCLCTDKIFDAGLLKKWNGMTTSFPLYRYSDNGTRMDNITDWGLEQFRKKYATTPNPLLSKEGTFRRSSSEQGRSKHPENIPKVTPITKEDIFHYVYAVLHNPAYRKKYEINLKREFPRIPLYDDFWKWAEWGKQLMDLHVNYEKAKGYALKSVGAIHESPNNKADGHPPKSRTQRVVSLRAKLKADKDNGAIIIDDETTLTGIPKEAWEYKLGNRSALEWVLDQHKESTPSDPTIAEKFNTYKFADYKKEVIELLKHVTTVSVETMKIIREMEKK
jgi:predicted helicase